MGNWHCIREGCARVIWREYLPPVVRWRYEGEDWQEIDGDDYTTEIKKQSWYGGQNPDVLYRYKYGSAIISGGTFAGWATNYSNQPAIVTLPILDVRLLISNVDYGVLEHWAFKQNGSGTPPPDGSIGRQYRLQVKDATEQWKNWINTSGRGHKFYGFEPANGSTEEPPKDCIFTITKDGEIVHTETRDICPEVEVLPCRLSNETKQIKVEKTPYLQRLEVVDYAYGNASQKVIFREKIPPECLNIYTVAVQQSIPEEGLGAIDTGFFRFFDGQICSVPGCPPPEYEVICNCDEQCPPGTCEVTCGSHICCYDTDTGKSVKEIPLPEFTDIGFPDNTRGAGS